MDAKLFRSNAIEMKRTRTSVALVSGYIRSAEKELTNKAYIHHVSKDIYGLCLSYYSIMQHYTNEYSEYIQMRCSDAIRVKNVFEFEFPQFGLKILELEVSALASDQNWGNTGHDYFNLTIKKLNNDKTTFGLFNIDHNKYPGFHRYSIKYTYDKDSDKLGLVEGGDKLIVACHCAPYPGWQLKVKNVEIKVIYEA
eukprot:UN01265